MQLFIDGKPVGPAVDSTGFDNWGGINGSQDNASAIGTKSNSGNGHGGSAAGVFGYSNFQGEIAFVRFHQTADIDFQYAPLPVVGGKITAQHTYASEGDYTATIEVVDNGGAKRIHKVPITIRNVAPTAADVSGLSTTEDAPLASVNVLAGATDPGGDPLRVRQRAFMLGGSVALVDGIVSYDPGTSTILNSLGAERRRSIRLLISWPMMPVRRIRGRLRLPSRERTTRPLQVANSLPSWRGRRSGNLLLDAKDIDSQPLRLVALRL
ncbi:MAG: Ig-like domain-containing protein [Pirellulaceae bacterium]